MAEAGSFAGSPPSRRTLYRRLIADPSSLPPDFFEKLDHKRKTLDESIHKFVAAKERELKQWIKEQRQLHKHQTQERGEKIEHARRRTSSESTHESTHNSNLLLLAGRMRSGLAGPGLLANTLRRDAEDDGSAIALDDDESREALETRAMEAGLADRRASTERDKDFMGIFTPVFLPAFADQDAEQAPSVSLPDVPAEKADTSPPPNLATFRSSSDSILQTESKRPAQLQLIQRSSSSSTERCLTSVLKSPTHTSRPNRKRVSLAVGDIIVAPSDSVPLETSQNNLLSHSRRRIGSVDTVMLQSELDLEASEVSHAPQATIIIHDSSLSAGSWSTATVHELTTADMNALGLSDMQNPPAHARGSPKMAQSTLPEQPAAKLELLRVSKSKPQKLDPDGDLFDLEDENSENDMDPDLVTEAAENEAGVVGRISRTGTGLTDASGAEQNNAYEDTELDTSDVEPEPDTPMSFRASSVIQPVSPGFRRPYAMQDPVYAGSTADYSRAEHRAVTDEVYGSSYARHSSKGSFGPGSLGEEFMARNAERLELQMRNRGLGQV